MKTEPDKTVLRSIRVTDAEWSKWQDAAAADGLTLSAWLKRLANNTIKRAENRKRR